MSDIFELEKVDAVFKINGVEYKLHDPCFTKKVEVLKGFEYVRVRNPQTTDEKYDVALEEHKLEKEYIRCYLPEVPDEVLETLGESAIDKLFGMLTKLAGDKFGANIRKIETEKKSLATNEASP